MLSDHERERLREVDRHLIAEGPGFPGPSMLAHSAWVVGIWRMPRLPEGRRPYPRTIGAGADQWIYEEV